MLQGVAKEPQNSQLTGSPKKEGKISAKKITPKNFTAENLKLISALA